MRSADQVFHLAIPCRDLEEAARFYRDALGCAVARRYEDRVTFNFFGDQLVCHLCPEQVPREPQMYPRHFGVTFLRREAFDRVRERAQAAGVRFFAEPFLRFQGRPEEHETFFLADPSHHLIEFKFYRDPRMVY